MIFSEILVRSQCHLSAYCEVQACTYLQRKEAGKQDLVSRDKVPLYLIPSAVGRNEVGEFLFHVGKFIVEMVLVPELSHFPEDFKHILKDICTPFGC